MEKHVEGSNTEVAVMGMMGTVGYANSETLNSWKEIAQYLDRGVRTVQRWERDLHLPVRRLPGRKRSAILALREEIDAWIGSCPILDEEEESTLGSREAEATMGEFFAAIADGQPAIASRRAPVVSTHNDGFPRVPIQSDKPEKSPAPAAVLLVDDNLAILELRRCLLETLGYKAIIVESGKKALEVLKSRIVDAVILDYLMPGMDGEETARRIRKLNPAVPIILSTGSWNLPEQVLGLVTELVEKGAGPGALITALERQLRNAVTRKASGRVA